MAGLGDVMHLVSGRQLLGTVREARDILLGHDVYGRPTAALEAAEADEGTERIGAIYEPGFSESGLGDGEESSRLRAGLAGDFGTRVEADDGGRARQNRSENEEGKSFGRSVPSGSGEAAQDAGSSESEQASSEDARSRDGPNASGQDVQSADDRPRSSAQTSGTESQTDGETGWRSGERSNYISSEKAVDGREESGDDFFATLELTQHEEVVGVATREWVPLAENGSRSGTATREEAGEDPERIDCISIYAVNRGESVNEQNGEEAKSGCGGLDWENTEQSGSKRGTEKGTEDRDAPESSSGRATQSGTESASRQGNNSQTGLENENRHNRAAHGNHDEKRSGSGSGHRNGNGNGNGVDGWAGDIEKLGMRYRQPQLLARIFGLRDGRPSTDVFREGVEKTHTLLQHRTPLVGNLFTSADA